MKEGGEGIWRKDNKPEGDKVNEEEREGKEVRAGGGIRRNMNDVGF